MAPKVNRSREGFRVRLEQRMQELDLTQTAVATGCDVTQSTVSDWLLKGAMPNSDVLLRLAPLLKCSLDWLLLGTRPGGERPSTTRAYQDGGVAVLAQIRQALDALDAEWKG